MYFDDEFLEGLRRKTLEKASILKSQAVFSTASTKDSKIVYVCPTFCPISLSGVGSRARRGLK